MFANETDGNGTVTKALKCGTPTQDDSDVFELVQFSNNIEGFRQTYNSTVCFMAFDEDGEQVAPCGLQTPSQKYVVLAMVDN